MSLTRMILGRNNHAVYTVALAVCWICAIGVGGVGSLLHPVILGEVISKIM